MVLLRQHQLPKAEDGRGPQSVVVLLIPRAAVTEESTCWVALTVGSSPPIDLESQCEMTGKARSLRTFYCFLEPLTFLDLYPSTPVYVPFSSLPFPPLSSCGTSEELSTEV